MCGIHGSDFFVFKLGIALIILGLLLTLPVSFGDVDLRRRGEE